MPESETLSLILEKKIIAVVRVAEAAALRECARAAAEGGIKLIGLPATVPGATELVGELRDGSDLCVGISDVVTQEQVGIALAADADFVLSPICDRDLVQRCRDRGLVMIAGSATPTEVVAAARRFPHLIAVFPAGALGGPNYLRVMAKQLPEIPLVASGGVDVDSGPDYLDAGAVAIIVDSGLFPEKLEPETAPIVATRARALIEVCAS